MTSAPTTDSKDDGSVAARITDALRDVLDPELGINIVDLGLVYAVDVAAGRAHVELTMTSPACPLGEELVRDATERVAGVRGVTGVDVDLVWDPPWTPELMTDAARDALGWGGT